MQGFDSPQPAFRSTADDRPPTITDAMSRSTITVSEGQKKAFDSFKDEGESVKSAFGRLLDAANGECTPGDDDVATEDDIEALAARIDEIAAMLPAQTADEVEGRLSRR